MTEEQLMEYQMVVEEYFQKKCIEIASVDINWYNTICIRTCDGHLFSVSINWHLKHILTSRDWILTRVDGNDFLCGSLEMLMSSKLI